MFILPHLKSLTGGNLGSFAFKGAALDLKFAANKSLVDSISGNNLVTFNRAAPAGSSTYVGSDGLIKTAVTNLLLRSEEFDNASWSKFQATVTANTATAPDGSSNVDSLIESAIAGTHVAFQNTTTGASTTQIFSVYAKANQRSRFQLFVSDTGANAISGIFNLTTGIVISATNAGTGSGATASVVSVGNGWYRCILTGIPASSGATVRAHCYILDNSSNQSYTGDGTSGIYLWGAQLEQSSTVGDYIQTTSAINSAPRFTHDPTTGESLGLLVEEARTNLLLRSEEFDNASWTKNALLAFGSGSTANAITAPSGAVSADLLTEDTTTSEHFTEQNFSATSGTTYAFSVFVKAGASKTTVVLRLTTAAWSGGANNQVRFNLSTGASTIIVGSPVAFSQNFGNGWWRFTIVSTASSTGTPAARIHLTDSSGNTNYAGDGTSGIYLWGAQLEAGALPTFYIPTTTATVTRAADVANITGTNFSSFYNQTEGTVFASATTNARHGGINSFPRILSVSDGTNNNQMETYYRVLSPYTDAGYGVTSAGVSQAQFDTNDNRNGQSIAFGYASNNFPLVIGGTVVATDTSGTVPTVSRLGLGVRGDGGIPLNGTIKRLTYWPTRLANTTLQQITT